MVMLCYIYIYIYVIVFRAPEELLADLRVATVGRPVERRPALAVRGPHGNTL